MPASLADSRTNTGRTAILQRKPMVRFIQTVGLFLVFALGVGRSESATVSDVSRSSYSKEEFAILRLQGEIVTGDASKVRAAIARLRPIDRIAIELDSPGGNYAEGLALAKLFRNEQVTTVVRNDKLCLSSCAIAFLGGARGRSGEARMMRLVEPRALSRPSQVERARSADHWKHLRVRAEILGLNNAA